MNIRCPNCQTVFKVDASRIPAAGVRARCARCAATFHVSPDGSASGAAPARAAQGAPAGKSRPAPPAASAAGAPEPKSDTTGAHAASGDPKAPEAPAGEPATGAPAGRGAEAADTTAAPSGGPFAEPSGASSAAPSGGPPTSSSAASGSAPQGPPPGTSPRPASADRSAGRPAEPSTGQGSSTAAGGRYVPAYAPPATGRKDIGAPHSSAAGRPASATDAAGSGMPETGSKPTTGGSVGGASPATSPRPGVFGSRDPKARAQRIARALVSDIVAYHPDRRDACLAAGTLRTEFRDEIMKSWEEYSAQVGEQMAKSTPYFRNALNDILAKGQSVF